MRAGRCPHTLARSIHRLTTDHLHGLKENVIIGRKIPVGTGVTQPVLADDETEFVDEVELDEAA